MNHPQHGHLPYQTTGPAPGGFGNCHARPKTGESKGRLMNRDDPAETDGTQTDTERRMAEYARRGVADAPPLPEAQRTKIAALFAPAVRELMREARQREDGRS